MKPEVGLWPNPEFAQHLCTWPNFGVELRLYSHSRPTTVASSIVDSLCAQLWLCRDAMAAVRQAIRGGTDKGCAAEASVSCFASCY